jgi:hypothetical protein
MTDQVVVEEIVGTIEVDDGGSITIVEDLVTIVSDAEQGPPGIEGPPGSDADVTAHEAALNPHPQYALDSEVAAALNALGTASVHNVEDFATAAQGALADTAVQPAALGTAAAKNISFFDLAGSADAALANHLAAADPHSQYALDTDLANYVAKTFTLNGHALNSGTLTLTKGDVGLGAVENTALSTWAGSTNITTIGALSALSVSGTPVFTAPSSGTPALKLYGVVGTPASQPMLEFYSNTTSNTRLFFITAGGGITTTNGITSQDAGSGTTIPLTLQSSGAQSADILLVKKSDGTKYLQVVGAGRVVVAGATDDGSTQLNVNGAAKATSIVAPSYTVVAPAAASASTAGNSIAISASGAVAGTVTAGAAAGGSVTITAGGAARLTSGDANGGDINLTSGTAVGAGRHGSVHVTSPGGSAADGRLRVTELLVDRPAIAITHGTNWHAIDITKSQGVGSALNATLASAQATGISLVNTTTSTFQNNSGVSAILASLSSATDSPTLTGGTFTGANTRTAAGAGWGASLLGNLAIGVDAKATSSIATAGVWGHAGRFVCGSTNVEGVRIKLATSQAAPALVVANSSNTTLMSVDSAGAVSAPTVTGTSGVNTSAKTVATLPAAADGLRSFVTDLNVTPAGNFGAAAVGGGSNKGPVYATSAGWFIG